MNTRTHVWLAALVLAGLLAPSGPARADRLPTKAHDEMVFESDPWRPDTKDPGRALADRGQSVLDERTETPPVREPAHRRAWNRVLMRILRFCNAWGIWR
jgi:hypothetical protein